MEPLDDAISTAVELELVRARVLADQEPLRSSVFPLTVFGGLLVLSAGVVLLVGSGWLWLFWMLAVILGGAVVQPHFRRVNAGAGLQPRGGKRLVAAGAASGPAIFVAAWLGGPVAFCVALALDAALFAALTGERALLVLAVALSALGLAAALTGADPWLAVALAAGVAMLATARVLS